MAFVYKSERKIDLTDLETAKNAVVGPGSYIGLTAHKKVLST